MSTGTSCRSSGRRSVSPIRRTSGTRAERIDRVRGMDDLQNLRQRLAEISDLSRAAGVLGWDQRVTMPPLGTDSRADSLAALGRVVHDRATHPGIGRNLERLQPPAGALPDDSG